MAKLDEYGREVLDQSPVSLPVRFRRLDSVTEDVRRLVREELSRQAASQGVETFDEADDFDIGDDYDPHSVYELDQECMDYDHRDEGRDDGGAEALNSADSAAGTAVQRSREEVAGGEEPVAGAERPPGATARSGEG